MKNSRKKCARNLQERRRTRQRGWSRRSFWKLLPKGVSATSSQVSSYSRKTETCSVVLQCRYYLSDYFVQVHSEFRCSPDNIFPIDCAGECLVLHLFLYPRDSYFVDTPGRPNERYCNDK